MDRKQRVVGKGSGVGPVVGAHAEVAEERKSHWVSGAVARSSLSGAAATNATLAWLGGGSLAVGGGGMAAGAAVLNLIAAAPAAFIGGLTVAVIGSKQKTSAKQYAAQVRIACENVQTAIELLPTLAQMPSSATKVIVRSAA
jgi:hypothetical protein